MNNTIRNKKEQLIKVDIYCFFIFQVVKLIWICKNMGGKAMFFTTCFFYGLKCSKASEQGLGLDHYTF